MLEINELIYNLDQVRDHQSALIFQSLILLLSLFQEKNESNKFGFPLELCCCCYPSLSMDKGMVEDHGAPETGQPPKPGLEVAETKESPQRAALRVRSWTVQNEMRGVLGQMSAALH